MHDIEAAAAADMQAVVLMGGLGTRLGLPDRPKAMADINGRPFFDYQLKLLERWKFRRFLFLAGHQGEYIENYYGDGSRRGIEILYSYDGGAQLGTGGALKNAEDKLEEDFLLIYGDSFMDADYQEIAYRYRLEKKAGMQGVMAVFKNGGRYDRSNAICEDGRLVLYDKANPDVRMEYIDYGVMALSKSILGRIKKDEASDLAGVLSELSREGKLAAHIADKRFYEIGNPGSMKEFASYAKRRFDEERGAVFFDRDGVINEFHYDENTEQIDSPFAKEDFRYRRGILEAMRSVQEMGHYIFIVTNQPAAAKGKASLESIYGLNRWMLQDLRQKGICVEAANICPHHPEGDREKGIPFLIGKCGCRKPAAGLITDLLGIYGIDRRHSYMVGDSYTDIIAGRRAGIRTVFLGSMKCDICRFLRNGRPDWIIQDAGELTEILKEDMDKA